MIQPKMIGIVSGIAAIADFCFLVLRASQISDVVAEF